MPTKDMPIGGEIRQPRRGAAGIAEDEEMAAHQFCSGKTVSPKAEAAAPRTASLFWLLETSICISRKALNCRVGKMRRLTALLPIVAGSVKGSTSGVPPC